MSKKLTFEDGYNQALKDYEKNPNLEDLDYNFRYGLKGFWFNNPKKPKDYNLFGEETKNDYKVILTQYDKGYRKALDDIEERIVKMDEKEKLSLKANLSHCIGLLEIDGTNTKAKVKKELKRILDVYFKEENENKNQ